jgi:hypothetical protein
MDKNLLKRRRERDKKMSRFELDWVFVGDGSEADVAYRHAQQNPQEKIIVIESQHLNYSLLPNMQHWGGDIIQWLEHYPSDSVGNVRCDFAFSDITLRVISQDPTQMYQGHAEIFKRIQQRVFNPQSREKIPNLQKNSRKYVGLVRQVLKPEGRFAFTESSLANMQGVEIITDVLRYHAFEVSVERLSEEQVLNYESHQAKCDLQEGYPIYRITGIKK